MLTALLATLFLSSINGQSLIFQDSTATTNSFFNNFPINTIPAIVTPGGTCICVTSGNCNRAGGSLYVPTDGSGLIDIRILNSGIFTGNGNTITTSIASTGITPIIASQTSCQSGLDICCLSSTYSCGIRFPPISGAPLPASFGQTFYGSYPWTALILTQFNNGYVGVGVLIDHMHVLTVAHRISAYASNPFGLKVRMGEWNIGSTSQPITPREFSVTRIFMHPQYNPQSLANTVAILRLSPNVPLGAVPTIGTACLSSAQITGSRCWVAGWGQNSFSNGTIQTIQTHVDLPLIDQATCQNQLRATRLGSGFTLDTFSFLCAGGISGRDACVGDGGAPLVCQVNSLWYVVGLVAWGVGCGTTNVPGVYVNVTNYIGWIQSTTISS